MPLRGMTGCSAQSVMGALTEVACWAHARRKIHDISISIQTATAEQALKRICKMYIAKEKIRVFPAAERPAARQSQSKLQLASLHE